MIMQCLVSLFAIAAAVPYTGRISKIYQHPKRLTPSGNYAPSKVPCPTSRLVRDGSSMSVNETEYIKARKIVTWTAMEEFLSRTKLSDYKDLFEDGYVPNMGLAFSGGGYRAMIDGAGRLSAFDWRNPAANESGQLGGLFQAANYITGLSGGSWLVGGLALNNFPTVFDQWHDVWNLEDHLLYPGGLNLVETAEYYYDVIDQVKEKRSAGFDVTITDIWGRMLSRHLINQTMYGTEGGPAAAWTDIRNQPQFLRHQVPFPIILADQRSPGTTAVPTNTSIYEFNPYEFGSFDASVSRFTPIEYMGSSLFNGVPSTPGQCVGGFDAASFCLGTSSSLFNAALLGLNGSAVSGLQKFVKDILTTLSHDMLDIASYPNPFYGIPGVEGSDDPELTLVDGGEDGQNVPLSALLEPVREIDVILTSDSSADTDTHWPNGTSLVSAYERSTASGLNRLSFVYIPDANTFVNLGLNTRPTFFGCDGSNVTTTTTVPPLIVYLPNAPLSFASNTSTFKLEYSNAQVARMLQNGWDVATRANGTLDDMWSTCLACAITQRSRERAKRVVPSECGACFQKYCWNGTIDSRPVVYDPTLQLAPLVGRVNA